MQQQTILKVSQIVQGQNPRRFFDEKEMAELESSIEAQGVIQPIAVRPLGDVFEIVAGERRWRASKKVFGDDYEIPVIIREMSDVEAAAASANENMIRASMSPSEEAEVAAKILGQHNGDFDEAAKRLGWSRSTLEKRLSLMQCSQNVRDALSNRKITLGHAELLATATKDKQDQVLDKLLKLANLPSITDFKQQLEQISKTLASAIFNKDECAGCQFNSTNQSQLFAEAISTGHCTNSQCYDLKTEAELVVRQDALKDEFPSVRIVRPGANFLQIKIVSEGATGVGIEQAKACRGCSNFGAVVSALPGSVGKVYKDQCFDTACNSNKVAERIKAEKATVAEKPKAKAPTSGQDAEKSATETETKAEPVTKVTVTDSNRVKEYRVKQWRKILVKELFSNEEKNRLVLLSLGICGLAQHMSSSKLSQAFSKLTGETVSSGSQNKFLNVATVLSSATDEVKARLHLALAASVEDQIEERNLREILTFLEVDMTKHWKLNKEYLDTMTKSEIDVILDEIGLKSHVGDGYAKLMGGKKDEIVKAALEVAGFDYEGKVPKVMLYQL
jgi:ParB family chromosome partitioning protein